MKNVRMSVKLVGGFLLVGLITLIVGLVGVTGLTGLTTNIQDISEEISAVKYLYTIKESGQGSTIVHRSLLNPAFTLKEREALYADNKRTREAIRAAREAYEQLPKNIGEHTTVRLIIE